MLPSLFLFDQPSKQNHVIHVVVRPWFVSDWARPVEDIEGSVPGHIAGIRPKLPVRQSAVGHFKVTDRNPNGEYIGARRHEVPQSFDRVGREGTTATPVLKRLDVC